jgi:hypothetical protein
MPDYYESADVWKEFGTIIDEGKNYPLSVSPDTLRFARDTITFAIISVSVTANESAASRTALITINASEGVSRTVALEKEAIRPPAP